MITDPIADLLARLRNAATARHASIDVPTSRTLARIAEILRDEGYLAAVKEIDGKPRRLLRITMKYDADGKSALSRLQRVSRSSRRVYRRAADLRPVLRGHGIAVVSTSRGILSDKECRRRKIGGEVLLKAW